MKWRHMMQGIIWCRAEILEGWCRWIHAELEARLPGMFGRIWFRSRSARFVFFTLCDVLETPECPAAPVASTQAPRFYMQTERLGMDRLIYPTLLFHNQRAVSHQVWSDGVWWAHGAKLGWCDGFMQVFLDDFSSKWAKTTLSLTGNRGVRFLQILVITRQASSPENAKAGRLKYAGLDKDAGLELLTHRSIRWDWSKSIR